MRFWTAIAAAVAVASLLAACGGGYGSSSNPATPSPPTGGTAGTTIAIVGDRGGQSFSPNPASVGSGSTVAFRNNDGVAHHIVANDGSFDTGVIPPGSVSGAMSMASDGANYHCTIHPGMVGSVNSSAGAPPPCTGQYCG